MKYDFDTVINRKNTNSIKWDCTDEIFHSNGILPLWIADMDFQSPQPVIDALTKRAEHGVYGYTESSKAYYDSIITWIYKRFDWKISSDWIINTPGVVPAIIFSILSFTEPKDKILVQSPVYHPFFSSITNTDRELVNCPLKNENGHYTMDYEGIEEKFKTGVKATIFCSPHNPVGRVWTKEELTKFGELCLKYNVLIISDEIHSDIIYKGNKHIPIASISKEFSKNTITCIAPSKTFNVAGLETAAAIIENTELHKKLSETLSKLWLGGSNVFGVTALEAAYTYGEEWLTQLLDYLEGNINYFIAFIEKKIPALTVHKPEGTYLLWVDCRNLGMNSKDLKSFFTETAKVGLNSGDMFGEGGEYFQRVNIGCPRAVLKEALERIEQAVNSQKNKTTN